MTTPRTQVLRAFLHGTFMPRDQCGVNATARDDRYEPDGESNRKKAARSCETLPRDAQN